MASRDRPPEQVTLPGRLRRRRRRVNEVDDVPEPEAPGRAVVAEERALVVQPGDGIRDAALDRLGNGPAVAGGPVGEHLAGLVRATQYGTDELAVAAVQPRG